MKNNLYDIIHSKTNSIMVKMLDTLFRSKQPVMVDLWNIERDMWQIKHISEQLINPEDRT